MDTLAVPLVRYSKHPLRGLLSTPLAPAVCLVVLGTLAVSAHAQMIDNTQASNPINAGINKSLAQEIGAGRGSVNTPDSSLFIINRDAFRAVRRGRPLSRYQVRVRARHRRCARRGIGGPGLR